MNALFEAALEVERLCHDRGWRYCFIGGIAVLRWGEPRLTLDADLTIVTGWGEEAPVVGALVERFSGRVADPAAFAAQHRVVLLRARNGVPIDIALGALPFEERSVGRASSYEIGDGHSLLTCGAEDLLVHKVFAGRDRDWADVEGIIARQARSIDWDLVLEEVQPLLAIKEDRSAVAKLHALRASLSES